MGNPVVHFEVLGTDGPSLEKFYAELFGWHVESMPEMSYGIVDTHAGGGINGGIGTSPEGGNLVTFYVEVDDLQTTLDRAQLLGGKTVVPITEIPNAVTFAQIADPQGNRLGLVKSEPGDAPGVSSGDGIEVSWFEVLGPDPRALVAFYTELFGWHATRNEMPGGFEYNEIDTHAGRGIGGGIGSSPTGQPMVTVYARVDDVQKYLERAGSLGGKTVVPVMKVSDELTIGQFADPQGNVFGLYKSER